MLASPQARDKLMKFFLAWLEVKEPEEFNIAASAFPEFTPAVAAAVVAETKSFLERQLGNAAPKMTDLTEATQSIVNSAEAFIYGVKAPSTPGLVDLDPTKRLGIFTQPAVIASHSGPTTTRLVKRGVFFVRKVMCIPMGNPPAGLDTTIPMAAGATERQRVETVTAQEKCAGCHGYINPFGFMQENFDAIGRWRTTDEGAPIDPSISVDFLDEGPLTTSSPVDALRTFTRSMRFQQCFARQLFRFYTGRDETGGDDPVLRQMFIDFANGGAGHRRHAARAGERAHFLSTRGGPVVTTVMKRDRSDGITRRELIKSFGPLAFLLMPVVRSMGYAATTPFAGMPRFVLFFKGPSFHSPTISPTTAITSLPAPLASLAPHAQDLILFKGMSILGGSPKTDGYKEEHAAGLIGCATGDAYHYSKNDSYYAYTDNESIDVAIANHYATLPTLASLPFASLHLGAGAQSDADNVGLGQRYVSWRKRVAGDTQYGNAIEPVQDAGQVYDTLMTRINAICGKDSNQPSSDQTQLRAALQRRQSLIDFRLADIADAKRTLGMDSVHAQKLDGLVDGWREVEKATTAELASLGSGAGTTADPGLPDGDPPDRQGPEPKQLRQARPGGRPDGRPHQAGLRVGSHPRRHADHVGRVERPPLAEPRGRQGPPHPGAQQRRRRAKHHGGVLRQQVRAAAVVAQGHRRRRRQDGALQQLGDAGHGMLERQLERSLPEEHPVHLRGPGGGRVHHRARRRRRRPQQQRSPDLDPERVGDRVRRLRPRQPLQGAYHLAGC